MRYGLNKFLGYLELILYIKIASRGLFENSKDRTVLKKINLEVSYVKQSGGLFLKHYGVSFVNLARRKGYPRFPAIRSSSTAQIRSHDDMNLYKISSIGSPILVLDLMTPGSVWLRSQVERSRSIPDSRNGATLFCVW
jgi:hypothetical protein